MPQYSDYVRVPYTRIALGSRQEAVQPGAFKGAIAEFFSTVIFVFAGQGSGIAFSKLTHDGPSTPTGLVAAAIAHGFALFVAVSASWNISGGHVNPAVTFGLFLGGNVTFFRAILYWIAQLLGATVACLLLDISTGGLSSAVFSFTAGSEWNVLVLEIVLTFGLVYTVYASAVDPKRGHIGTVGPLAIGLVVAANILVGGAFDGGAMNPALAFGPALVGWSWEGHWVYWVGPLVGGGLAGAIYEIFFIDHSHEHIPAAEY